MKALRRKVEVVRKCCLYYYIIYYLILLSILLIYKVFYNECIFICQILYFWFFQNIFNYMFRFIEWEYYEIFHKTQLPIKNHNNKRIGRLIYDTLMYWIVGGGQTLVWRGNHREQKQNLNNVTKKNLSTDSISYRLRMCTLWCFHKPLLIGSVIFCLPSMLLCNMFLVIILNEL